MTQKTLLMSFAPSARRYETTLTFIAAWFETDQRILDLFSSVAPLCFGDICRILQENLHIQFCKITDPARTGKKANLTTNCIVEEIPWPDTVGQRLREVNVRLMSFRRLIEPARSKRIAHLDLPAQVEQWANLGSFPAGAEIFNSFRISKGSLTSHTGISTRATADRLP